MLILKFLSGKRLVNTYVILCIHIFKCLIGWSKMLNIVERHFLMSLEKKLT